MGAPTHPAALPDWPQFTDAMQALPMRACRSAIERAARLVQARSGRKRWLAPAYHCGSELDALRAAGAEVELYAISERLHVDAADFERRLGEDVAGALVIHYFGWPQPETARLAALCRDAGGALLEDCAHALFSRHGAAWPGTQGDVATFSLTKTLDVPDGGVLIARMPLDEPPMAPADQSLVAGWRRARRRQSLMDKTPGPLVDPIVAARRARRAGSADDLRWMPGSYRFDPAFRDAAMTAASIEIAGGVDPAAVIRLHRSRFERCSDALFDLPGAALLFEGLPAGVCPLVFPLLVEERDKAYFALQRAGVDVIPWWAGRHPDIDIEGFEHAARLKSSVLAVPLSERVSDLRFDRTLERIRRHWPLRAAVGASAGRGRA